MKSGQSKSNEFKIKEIADIIKQQKKKKKITHTFKLLQTNKQTNKKIHKTHFFFLGRLGDQFLKFCVCFLLLLSNPYPYT